MKAGFKKTLKIDNRAYSVQAFIKRVVIMLLALVTAFSAVVFLLIYLPLKGELVESLINNFDQISYIRYASLQNNMDRGVEGAGSLSSRTMIRNAILEYENGEMTMDELIAYTQPKYEDGIKALKYLVRAERFVGDNLIAKYISADYKDHSCATDDRLIESNEISSALCLTDDHSYFAILSPILSGGRVIGYDKLVFDLSDQIQMLCTDTIELELIYYDEFKETFSDADMVQSGTASSLYYKQGVYYQVFRIQDSAYFISKQSETSLLDPVYRLSRQTLLAGISILLAFTSAVYFLVVQYARVELINLESSRCSLKEAVSEANLDPLTKAGSRRFGEELLTSEFEKFQIGEPSPDILMFDIDSLKQINDTYGHSAGDLVIRSVAEAVQNGIRSGDVLLRWGGDEFIGAFAGLSKENAMPSAQKLLNAVSDLQIETDSETINPTISIGISFFREEDLSFIDAVNRADRAMYQSKAEGRNRAHEL